MTGRLLVLRINKDMSPVSETSQSRLDVKEHEVSTFWDTSELVEQFGPPGTTNIWRYHEYGANAQAMHRLDVFCMLVRIMDEEADSRDYEEPMLKGLLLLPTDQSGEFRRVGLLELSENRLYDGLGPLNRSTDVKNSHYYLSKDGRSNYRICIV
jgi:hypothetical protein